MSTFVLSFFHWCLSLYPPVFRVMYGEEVETVFRLSLEDAVQGGGFELVRFCSRELRDIPGALVRAHVRERRVSMTASDGYGFQEQAPRGWKGAAFYLPFGFILLVDLAVLLFPPLGNFRPVTRIVSMICLLGILGLALFGLIKKMPGWAVPSLGMSLAFGNLALVIVFLSMGANASFVPMLDPVLSANPAPYSFLSVFYSALRGMLFVLPILLVTGLFIWLAALIPAYQSVFQRICQDWSQVSLLIYINYLLTPGIVFDPPAGSTPYKLIAYALLAAGAWLYLHSNGAWKRLAVLAAAACLAQSALAAGEYFLYIAPGSNFLSMLGWYIGQAQIINVMGTVLPLAIPALLSLVSAPPALLKTR